MENMENTENMEKMENVNHKTKNTLFMNTLFVTQNILFAKQMTQKTLFILRHLCRRFEKS